MILWEAFTGVANMKKLFILVLIFMLTGCPKKVEDKRKVRQNQVHGCRGNYDCEKGHHCAGNKKELLAGRGLCVDIYHPRRDIKMY